MTPFNNTQDIGQIWGKWITYKIPSELSEQIDEFIENQGKKILYPTKAQFMAAAIRNHLYRERSSESVRISKTYWKRFG